MTAATLTNRQVLGLSLIAGLVACLSCSKMTDLDYGQGFHLVQYQPREVVPNLFGVGRSIDVLRMQVGGRWKEVARGGMTVRTMDGGMFVVHVSDQGTGWRIYRSGNENYARLQTGDCAGTVIRTRDRRGLQCIVIRGGRPETNTYRNRFNMQAGPSTAIVTRFDMDGTIVDRRSARLPEPIAGGWCDGGADTDRSTANDELVVQIECTNPDSDRATRPRLFFRYAVMPGYVRALRSGERLEGDSDRDDEYDRLNRGR